MNVVTAMMFQGEVRSMNKRRGVLPIFAVLGVVAAGGASWLHKETKLNNLVESIPSGRFANHRLTREEKREYREKRLRFFSLWQARHQRDVTGDILPFLQDSSPRIRLQAVKALGRLEDARAENVLAQLVESKQKPITSGNEGLLQGGSENRPDKLGLAAKIALGRIRSRNLKGQEKLDAVCQAVDLSFSDVAPLAQKINASDRRAYMVGSPGDTIVNEIVDVLYTMHKKGEDIQPWIDGLNLSEEQKIELEGAGLPPQREVALLLEYISQRKIVRASSAGVEQRLIGLGPQVSDAALEQLADVAEHKEKYADKAISALLFIPASTGDRRAIPFLKNVENKFLDEARKGPGTHGYWTYVYASDAREAIEKGTWLPPELP